MRFSNSANKTAMLRAIESTRKNSLFNDSVACKFVTPVYRYILKWRISREMYRYYKEHTLPGMIEFINARAFWSEKSISQSVLRNVQIVILGSGLDSFSIRDCSDVIIHEIDRKFLFDYKIPLIKELFPSKLERIEAVVTDFKDNNTLSDLLSHSISDQKEIMATLMGVIYYLDETSIKNLLHSIGSLTEKHVKICLDYLEPLAFADSNIYNRLAKLRAKRRKEPIKTLYSKKDFFKLCESVGYKVSQDIRAVEVLNEVQSEKRNCLTNARFAILEKTDDNN